MQHNGPLAAGPGSGPWGRVVGGSKGRYYFYSFRNQYLWLDVYTQKNKQCRGLGVADEASGQRLIGE